MNIASIFGKASYVCPHLLSIQYITNYAEQIDLHVPCNGKIITFCDNLQLVNFLCVHDNMNNSSPSAFDSGCEQFHNIHNNNDSSLYQLASAA